MRTGDFSELLNPSNGFFNGARTIIDPQTGQPFPGNIIPAGRLSPNGMAILNAYPLPTPGFRQGSANSIISSPNPQDQRKDNLRLDYRLNASNQFTYRYSKYNWKAVDAFRGGMTFARTDWDRPNQTQTASWTADDQEQPDQRAQLHLLEGRRLHQRLHRGRRLSAQQVRDQLSRTSSRRRKSSTRCRR